MKISPEGTRNTYSCPTLWIRLSAELIRYAITTLRYARRAYALGNECVSPMC